MYIYLPIAELSINIWLILAIGAASGVLSGMFGIGGGFLSTPLLIFSGVPAAVAVSTSASQMVAASFSGFLVHQKKGNIDFVIGSILLTGGIVGSTLGVYIFSILKQIGQIDTVISLFYTFFLGTIGLLMFKESFGLAVAEHQHRLHRAKKMRSFESLAGFIVRFASDHNRPKKTDGFIVRCLRNMPLKISLSKSGIDVSLISVVFISFFSGILVSIMGIGGGFLMVPAMIYIFRMPTQIAVGTSLFQTIFITSNTAMLQSITNHTVDIVLAFFTILSSVIGAQIGSRICFKSGAATLRTGLSMIIIIVAAIVATKLFVPPKELYDVMAL